MLDYDCVFTSYCMPACLRLSLWTTLVSPHMLDMGVRSNKFVFVGWESTSPLFAYRPAFMPRVRSSGGLHQPMDWAAMVQFKARFMILVWPESPFCLFLDVWLGLVSRMHTLSRRLES